MGSGPSKSDSPNCRRRHRSVLTSIRTTARFLRLAARKTDPTSRSTSDGPQACTDQAEDTRPAEQVAPSREPIYELVRNPSRVMAAAMIGRLGSEERPVIIVDVDRNESRDRDPVRFVPCQIGEAERAMLSTSFPAEILDMCVGQTAWLGVSARPATVHSRVDYTHQLVSDLGSIASCSFYWGKIDRYEAERLLDNHPEGTFLLRDSAQEGHLFSVSFRRFGRSLHARIELSNSHQFTFDSHDPNVFSAPTVSELIAHYKQPAHCMFFEPMLFKPLNRKFVFSLQHYARIAITARVSYDQVDSLPLPGSVRSYLREYHYRFKLTTQHLHDPGPSIESSCPHPVHNSHPV